MSQQTPRVLTTEWLTSLGYETLTEPQKYTLLRAVYDALETRVGSRLASGMSDQQLDEFLLYVEHPDDDATEATAAWLQRNRPDYREVVARTIKDLENELRQIATVSMDDMTWDENGRLKPETQEKMDLIP